MDQASLLPPKAILVHALRPEGIHPITNSCRPKTVVPRQLTG